MVQRRQFVMRLQQFTGTVMAKSLEDTAFYRYFPLTSLNEVGGHPESFGAPLAEFHLRNATRLKEWPNAMLATSTHDTKRSEDVRARINVLSEIPGEWHQTLHSWAAMNQSAKVEINGRLAPDNNEEYLIYQTLLGFWPPGPLDEDARREATARLAAYLTKALREAKLHTSWVNPLEVYENAVHQFIHTILEPAPGNLFPAAMGEFRDHILRAGLLNSLGQVLLKTAAPGVPDFYQGTELWDFSLVDPDNRRPVDYELRRALLAAQRRDEQHHGRAALLESLAGDLESGALKMHFTRTLLEARNAEPTCSPAATTCRSAPPGPPSPRHRLRPPSRRIHRHRPLRPLFPATRRRGPDARRRGRLGRYRHPASQALDRRPLARRAQRPPV